MKKSELKTKTEAAFDNTRDCLQLVYDSITAQGQRKKLLKNEKVVEMFDHYGVQYEEDGK